MLRRMVIKLGLALGVGVLVIVVCGDADAYRSAGRGAARFSGRANPGVRRPYIPQRAPHSFHQHRPLTSPSTRPWHRIFRAPPAGHRAFSRRGSRYLYYGGRPYLNTPAGAVPVMSPIGTTRDTLPVGYVKVAVKSKPYFYHGGTFYRYAPRSRQYVVIAPPVGAKVPSIPLGYETVYIDSLKYYKLGEVYYRSAYRRGVLVFEVVNVD